MLVYRCWEYELKQHAALNWSARAYFQGADELHVEDCYDEEEADEAIQAEIDNYWNDLRNGD